jgi:glutamine amidotransferase
MSEFGALIHERLRTAETFYLLSDLPGNTGSVTRWIEKSFDAVNIRLIPASEIGSIEISHKNVLILSGGANTRAYLTLLNSGDGAESIKSYILNGGLGLGICSGAQICLDYLEEADTPGLGLLEGNCIKLSDKSDGLGLNIGFRDVVSDLDCVKKYYFMHSFKMMVEPEKVAAWCVFEDVKLAAGFCINQFFGVQFHIEFSDFSSRKNESEF